MKITCSSALFATALSLSSGFALAQDQSGTPPERKAPATDASRPGTLSDKLSDTGGVIHPSENVDPHIDKGAPATSGNTRVIKPPGMDGKSGPTSK